MAILTWRELSVMMQKRVISEAVPAVVLMEMRGIMGLGATSMPEAGRQKKRKGCERVQSKLSTRWSSRKRFLLYGICDSTPGAYRGRLGVLEPRKQAPHTERS